jgi:hypothetical protein
MIRIYTLFSVLLIVLLAGCSDEHGSSPTAYDYDPLSAPDSLEAEPGVESISLSWSHPGGYREFIIYFVYYSGAEAIHQAVDTTSVTTVTVDELVPNLEYCFSVSAVDSSGIEGWRSEEVCAMAGSN